MNRLLPVAIALLTVVLPAAAQDVCPCVPVTHLWVVKSCDTFDCAASAFVVANGSTDTMVVPTSSGDVKWVVLERIASGSGISLDPTFKLESFEAWPDASLRFGGLDTALKPMLLSSPDGRFLIVARNAPEPRRRAAHH